jgi:hypothetical protein
MSSRSSPLIEIHFWGFDDAVIARYFQDKVSSVLAEQFRRDVFANLRRSPTRTTSLA